MLVYTFFFEVPAFRKMMRFVICTYSVTMAIYILFPTARTSAPPASPGTISSHRFMAWFYTFDTNTNVCLPSTSSARWRPSTPGGKAAASARGRGGSSSQ